MRNQVSVNDDKYTNIVLSHAWQENKILLLIQNQLNQWFIT